MSSTRHPTEYLQRAGQLSKDGNVINAFYAVKRVLKYPSMCSSEAAVFSKAMSIFVPVAHQVVGEEHVDVMLAAANDPDHRVLF